MWLLLALLAIPLIEIALFIQIGGVIGLPLTLLAIIFTAILGMFLLRHQGIGELAKLQQRLANGENPTTPILHGAILIFAGAFLLTPGFFTDTLGFALMIPKLRDGLIGLVASRLMKNMQFHQSNAGRASHHTLHDVQYEETDPSDTAAANRQDPPSGWTDKG